MRDKKNPHISIYSYPHTLYLPETSGISICTRTPGELTYVAVWFDRHDPGYMVAFKVLSSLR